MNISPELQKALTDLMHTSVQKELVSGDFRAICQCAGVAKMYYDMNLGDPFRYRDQRTDRLVMAEEERGDKIFLYDSGEETLLQRKYTFYYNGVEFVHAYIEFAKNVKEEDIDEELYAYLADIVFSLISRQNMRKMLDYAEMTDMQTGIPNSIQLRSFYHSLISTVPPEDLYVVYINLQHFKFINESSGAAAGDEAIVQYSRHLVRMMKDGEFACRMGGDNFVLLVRKENFRELVEKLHCVRLMDLQHAPNRTYEIAAWIGVSDMEPGEKKGLRTRIEEASNACGIAKSKIRKDVLFYNKEIGRIMGSRMHIIGMFGPAVKNHEFKPYYQPKVDMRTGELIGFEALCRWIHGDEFIMPDQFIPILDREGLIHDLDMIIFRQACEAIRSWKDEGLTPPRVSTNFSRKNLFVPGIENKILDTIRNCGISTRDVEIEITETVQESEFQRLMEFVHTLKKAGLHISVDDFGTGYSSLSMIRNIDADAIKIDKSFVEEAPRDKKSRVLIDSITHIASQLEMDIVAEGVETAEQGKRLMQYGCYTAQGFYYSRPVSFEAATEIIRNPHFRPIADISEA